MADSMDTERQITDLKIDNLTSQIQGLTRSFDEKIANLINTVKDGNQNIFKLLDDHETRLREQAKTDSQQGNEISTLREKFAELKGQVDRIEMRQIQQEQRDQERSEKENSDLRRIAWDLGKMVLAAGGGAGGAYIAHLLRVF